MEKRSEIYYRTKLLLSIMEMKLSESTSSRITMIIRKAPKDLKESMAESLMDMLKKCNSEKDVLKELGAFSGQSEQVE